MRKFNVKSLVRRLAAVPAVVMASGAVFAQQAAPTTATALAQSIDLSEAKSSGLIVVGLLIAVGVTLWGARLVLTHFRPK